MKVLTLNTHSWHEEKQLDKIKHLAQVIKENDYDIIALQEVNQMVAAKFLADGILREDNYMLVLLQELEKIGAPKYYSYWNQSKVVRNSFEEGSCILSKYPIEETECFTVSKVTDPDALKKRNIMRVTIQCKNELMDIYTCHMGWWHDEIEPFKYQGDLLLKKLNKDRFSLLMGDFNNNANIRGEGYDYLLLGGLVDTYTLAEEKDDGATVQGEIAGWTGNKLDLRIDLILMTKEVAVKTSRVIFNGRHQEIISDHYGVEVELNI